MDEHFTESPHYRTCTHKMDKVLLEKEAEAVAVYWDSLRNVYHYSLRVGDWYGCKVVSLKTFQEYQDQPQRELDFLQSEARFLRTLHGVQE